MQLVTDRPDRACSNNLKCSKHLDFSLSTLLTPEENRLWTHLPTMRVSEVRVHYRTERLAWLGLACVPSQLCFPQSSLLHPLVCDLEINPGLPLWRTFQPLKTSQRRRRARRCRCMCTLLADSTTPFASESLLWLFSWSNGKVKEWTNGLLFKKQYCDVFIVLLRYHYNDCNTNGSFDFLHIYPENKKMIRCVNHKLIKKNNCTFFISLKASICLVLVCSKWILAYSEGMSVLISCTAAVFISPVISSLSQKEQTYCTSSFSQIIDFILMIPPVCSILFSLINTFNCLLVLFLRCSDAAIDL